MPTRLHAVRTIATAVALGAAASAAFLPHAAAVPRQPRTEPLQMTEPRRPKTPDLPDLHAVVSDLTDREDSEPSIADHIAAAPPEETPRDPEPSRTPRQIAVATAKAQIGDPYRWGGTGPDSFDCSGLVGFAWKAAGVDLPRTSRAQFAALPRVDLDSVRPGDLVFSGYGRVTHVGMYVGDGQMVHSPNSGKRVEIAPLHSNVIGAGRPAA